jgi:chromosome segregation ATPase
MNTIKSFVKQFAAVLKGDDAEATAQKALRQADSALQTQIASLKGDTIVKEDNLNAAKEHQALARVNNGRLITQRDSYVANLLSAKNGVTAAEEDLKAHKEKIAFLEAELKSLGDDVAA